jgi:hypothetical protein
MLQDDTVCLITRICICSCSPGLRRISQGARWTNFIQISQLLTAKAVVLRIEGGSREAGFLSAFCPVEQPSLVVIQ